MPEIVFGICGMAVGIAGIVFSFVNTSRNKKNDDKSEGEKEGVILEKLNHIKETTESIEKRLAIKDEQDMAFVRQLAAVEASAKQAHKRIDQLFKYHQPGN